MSPTFRFPCYSPAPSMVSIPRSSDPRRSASSMLTFPVSAFPRSGIAAEAHQGIDRPFRDVLDRPCRVQSHEDALVRIKVDQRRRLLGVDLEPVPDGLLPVVVTLEQLTPALVAGALP